MELEINEEFENYADVAADIVNALLQVVTGEEMLTAATESLAETNTLHNQLEDVAKYHITGGIPRAMFLFANQTKVDKGMILRKAGYIGGEYRRQYEKQNHGLYPVVELVLYWGTSRWKGADIYDSSWIDGGKGKIVETTWKYVDDMQLHVWKCDIYPKRYREHFQSDMRIVLIIFAEGNGYRSDRKVVHKEATIKMLRVLSGDKNVEDTREILKSIRYYRGG